MSVGLGAWHPHKMGDNSLQVRDAEKTALKFETPSLAPNAAPGDQPGGRAPVSENRKRLVFVIAHLGPGGAQR
ncbi:MAG TPA: hypothetical protein VJK06_04370, partial [Methyloceanibacter sp.]|nr:hypothetical protein [Methyloceanibacter sp.]